MAVPSNGSARHQPVEVRTRKNRRGSAVGTVTRCHVPSPAVAPGSNQLPAAIDPDESRLWSNPGVVG